MNQYIMIAFTFPPVGGSGVQRPSKLAKFSLQRSWEPLVVSADGPPPWNLPVDQTLLTGIENVRIKRTSRLELRYIARLLHKLELHDLAVKSEWIIPLDGFLGWVPYAIRAAEQWIKQEKPTLVWTTGMPFSTHLVGLYLKQRYGIPWVADYRDPVTTNDLFPQYDNNTALSRFKFKMDREFEKSFYKHADHSTVVVKKHRDDIINTFNISDKKVSIIYNGYDEDDFKGFDFPISPHKDLFRISYIGSFYRRDYNPELFLKMLRQFIAQCSKPEAVRFCCVGGSVTWMEANKGLWSDLEKHIELVPYVPHSEVPVRMSQSTVLLNIFARPWAVTGKLFESLRSGLPLLGLAPVRHTLMERIITDSDTGHVVEHDNVEAGVSVLMDYFRQWLENQWTLQPDFTVINRYSRRNQSDIFINLFEDITSQD